MKNKFVYFCRVNIHALGFSGLLQSIFCLLLVVGVFSLQKVFEMLGGVVVAWRGGSQLGRGQVNVTHEAKLFSPINSTFEALVVRCVVRCCGKELGCFC